MQVWVAHGDEEMFAYSVEFFGEVFDFFVEVLDFYPNKGASLH